MKPIALLLKKDDEKIEQNSNKDTDTKDTKENKKKDPTWKEPFPNRIGENIDG